MKLGIELSNIGNGNYYLYYQFQEKNEHFFVFGGAIAEGENGLRKVCGDICSEYSGYYIYLVNSKGFKIKRRLFKDLERNITNFKRL